MATYFAYCRSNYFRVKSIEKFQEFCMKFQLNFIQEQVNILSQSTPDPNRAVGFLIEDGGIPNSFTNEMDEIVDVEFFDLLAEHLQEKEVAIVQEIGWEKMRYFVGVAIAVNSEGVTRTVSLEDIYDVAHELTSKTDISRCEY